MGFFLYIFFFIAKQKIKKKSLDSESTRGGESNACYLIFEMLYTKFFLCYSLHLNYAKKKKFQGQKC